MSRLLLCTDLDQTLLPNGPELGSKQARRKFHELFDHTQVTLVYVTGRHQQQVHSINQNDGLYLARGDFMGMNGNCSAGILEGVAHFIPQVKLWL